MSINELPQLFMNNFQLRSIPQTVPGTSFTRTGVPRKFDLSPCFLFTCLFSSITCKTFHGIFPNSNNKIKNKYKEI